MYIQFAAADYAGYFWSYKVNAMKHILTLSLLVLLASTSYAQDAGIGYTIKGGFTLGLQQWNQSEFDPLLSYNTSVMLEQLGDQFSLFGQLGYHRKGSAVRTNRFVDNQGNVFPGRTFELAFHNLSLVLGAKSFYKSTDRADLYYLLGARADYTMRTDLELYQGFGQFTNDFNYGVTLATGIEFPVAEYVGVQVELTVSPDFSQQIYVPPGSYTNTFTGQVVNFGEREVYNTVVELTVGIRLRQEVEYIEDDF